MISLTAQYALRTAVFLAYQDQPYLNRNQIAEGTLVPSEYLLKVLGALESNGLVESRRGPGGGYRLKHQPHETTALQIIEPFSDLSKIEKCPLGIYSREGLCPLHKLLDEATATVRQTFKRTTIGDLVQQEKKRKSCKFPKM